MDLSFKTFLTIVAVSMLTIGTLTPALAVSPKAYSFENNLEVTMPDVAYEQAYVPGEILVKFNPGVSEAKIKATNSKNGASVTYTSPHAGFKKLNIPKTKSVEEMVEIYSKNPNVEYATANYVMHAAMVPNDPYYNPYQWNFYSEHSINVTDAWDISTGQGVVVAVLDTGIAYNDYYIDYQNYDLANTNFKQGYDFINGDSDPTDDQGHGTHVAGTIAQSTNNDKGVAGVAYDCTLMPVKVLNHEGSGTLAALIDGIYFATDNGAQVISMSLGFDPNLNPRIFKSLTKALDYADRNNVVIVAAAGNDGISMIGYPAAYDKCISVGATRYDGTRAYYSNYGTAIDIMAPGGDVTIDQNGDTYGDGILQNTFDADGFNYFFYQGTSMATPHVSGVAALLIANGVTGPDNVRAAIEKTAQDIYTPGWDADSGYGIVDSYAALNYAVHEPVNHAPVAVIEMPTSAGIDETITFDASDSYDLDGDTLSYSWDFDNDGVEDSIDKVTTHSYSTVADHNVSLTVSDGELSSTATKTISISEIGVIQPFDVEIIVETTTKPAGKNIFAYATATVTVTSSGNRVSGADITGHWVGLANNMDSATTDANGTAIVVSDSGKYSVNTELNFDFVVDSVNGDPIS